MLSPKTKNVLLVILIVALPLAYFAGGVHGFGKGHAASQYLESGDTKWTVYMLRQLRKGDTNSTIGILETRLDSLILQYDRNQNAYQSIFNLPKFAFPDFTATMDNLVSPAIDYRREFPSQCPVQEVKVLIDESLSRLDSRKRDKGIYK